MTSAEEKCISSFLGEASEYQKSAVDEAQNNIGKVERILLDFFWEEFCYSTDRTFQKKIDGICPEINDIEKLKCEFSIDDDIYHGAVMYNTYQNADRIVFLKNGKEIFPVLENELKSYMENLGFRNLSSCGYGVGFLIGREDFYKKFILKSSRSMSFLNSCENMVKDEAETNIEKLSLKILKDFRKKICDGTKYFEVEFRGFSLDANNFESLDCKTKQKLVGVMYHNFKERRASSSYSECFGVKKKYTSNDMMLLSVDGKILPILEGDFKDYMYREYNFTSLFCGNGIRLMCSKEKLMNRFCDVVGKKNILKRIK